eukprot:2454933-Pleurochrysis_carterae.AAC.1
MAWGSQRRDRPRHIPTGQAKICRRARRRKSDHRASAMAGRRRDQRIGSPQSTEPIQPVQPCIRLSQVHARPEPRAPPA